MFVSLYKNEFLFSMDSQTKLFINRLIGISYFFVLRISSTMTRAVVLEPLIIA